MGTFRKPRRFLESKVTSDMEHKPMREDELRQHAECSVCGQRIGEASAPAFAVVVIQGHVLDIMALQRQQGLTMMMGGHAALARVMGPDQEMTKTTANETRTVCFDCMSRPLTINDLILGPLADEPAEEETDS